MLGHGIYVDWDIDDYRKIDGRYQTEFILKNGSKHLNGLHSSHGRVVADEINSLTINIELKLDKLVSGTKSEPR
jgi:hypothetical protein